MRRRRLGIRHALGIDRSFDPRNDDGKHASWPLAVERYRLERWKERALRAVDASLRGRGTEPVEVELAEAHERIGELSMKIELLEARCKTAGPLPWRRSRR